MSFLINSFIFGGGCFPYVTPPVFLDTIPVNSILYWATDFESGSVTQTGGIAAATDVSVLRNNGTITTAQSYAGTRSYLIDTTATSTNNFSLGVAPSALSATNGFMVDFWARKTGVHDTHPVLFTIGSDNTDTWLRNSYTLRWVYNGDYASKFGLDGCSQESIITDNTTWSTNNTWERITYFYDQTYKYGYVYVNGILKHHGHQRKGWNTDNGKVIIDFGNNFPYPSDSGIQVYIDNISLSILKTPPLGVNVFGLEINTNNV